MKLLGNTNCKTTQDENGKKVPHLEITEVVLVDGNIVKSDHQHDSNDLFIFIPNKSFSQLVDISPKNFIFPETLNSEFSYIEVWFTNHVSELLEIGDKINVTLIIT